MKKPFIYVHELLETVNGTGGIWIGCPIEESVRASYIEGETGEQIIALYKSADYESLRALNGELLEALEKAMAFIESHVADSDITAEMRKTYVALQACKPYEVIAKARGES